MRRSRRVATVIIRNLRGNDKRGADEEKVLQKTDEGIRRGVMLRYMNKRKRRTQMIETVGHVRRL